MAGATFAARGRPVSAIVETLKPARWNERVQRTRVAAGVKAIPIENGPREMIATLRKQEGLAVLVDRPLEVDGVPVTFFGRSTRVPGGAAGRTRQPAPRARARTVASRDSACLPPRRAELLGHARPAALQPPATYGTGRRPRHRTHRRGTCRWARRDLRGTPSGQRGFCGADPARAGVPRGRPHRAVRASRGVCILRTPAPGAGYATVALRHGWTARAAAGAAA